MGDSDIAQRVLSAECGIPYRNLRTGRVSEDEGRRYMDAATKLQSLPIEISGAHIRDVGAIFATAKRVQKRWASQTNDKFSGLRLIVVDYLQLVRTPAKDRFQMVAEVSMGLKALAKQLEVPVVALAQLNAKSVTERDDHRPRLSDLRESGQIEQDADMILFCHRDHYWLERMGAPRGRDGKVDYEKMADHDANMRACANQMDVLLAKARFGGIGDVKLGVDMALNRVWSLSDTQNAMGF
jgi:replicative DNA helicase